MVSVLDKYLQLLKEATSRPGVYAYRGQSNADWPLHSAATRHLIKNSGVDPSDAVLFPQVYFDHHSLTLVDAARTRGFGVESGRDISDLQLLAKLQHFGAPTGLLDFTWNPLVALWFAVRELGSNGKLFILNATDPIQVGKVPSNPESQTIGAVFSRPENAPSVLHWEPMWSGDAMPRILRQRSVFIIGRPLIPTQTQIIGEFEIAEEDKAPLLEELALLDVSEPNLFPDIFGFASLVGTTDAIPVRTPQSYLIQGNQHYQAGEYTSAIAAYDSCIDLAPDVGELYLLRGNAKSEVGLYEEAVGDYRQAIACRERPFLGMGSVENPSVLGLMSFMAHFNCGNALAASLEYEAASNSFSEAIQIDTAGLLNKEQAFFNRGNIYQDLGRFGEAVEDYNAAISLQANGRELPGIFFNKGNALVASGHFKEAKECYRQADQRNEDANSPSRNRATLERVLNAIGSNDYQCRYVRNPDAPVNRVVVEVAGSDHEALIGLFQGRVGNTGNFGWHGVGGKGFGGSDGFIVEVVGQQ